MGQIEITDDKQEMILEAALKRFAHYGPSKTTMNEIADDLHLSKALLYYYFPDKASLFKAVINRILNIYFLKIECEANHAKSIEKALMNTIEIRHDFFMKYFNMGLNRNFLYCTEGSMDETILKAVQKEKEFMANLFEKAKSTGELKINNPQETADLYIDLMIGIRFGVIAPNSKVTMLDADMVKSIHKKHKLMTEIFIKGLKNHN